jgi:hypothetical protein
LRLAKRSPPKPPPQGESPPKNTGEPPLVFLRTLVFSLQRPFSSSLTLKPSLRGIRNTYQNTPRLRHFRHYKTFFGDFQEKTAKKSTLAPPNASKRKIGRAAALLRRPLEKRRFFQRNQKENGARRKTRRTPS